MFLYIMRSVLGDEEGCRIRRINLRLIIALCQTAMVDRYVFAPELMCLLAKILMNQWMDLNDVKLHLIYF